MEQKVYNQKGEEAGKIKLPESIFGVPWNADLVHQVVVAMTSSMRHSIANTKTRGEVSGGGKKPWQQKGTGRARHGSTRSPIWVGGGIAHGPRKEKNYDRKINKKARAKALWPSRDATPLLFPPPNAPMMRPLGWSHSENYALRHPDAKLINTEMIARTSRM